MRLGTVVMLLAIVTSIAFYPTELIWLIGKFVTGITIIFNYIVGLI